MRLRWFRPFSFALAVAILSQPGALRGQSKSVFIPLWSDFTSVWGGASDGAKVVTTEVAWYRSGSADRSPIEIRNAYGDIDVASTEDCKKNLQNLPLAGYGVPNFGCVGFQGVKPLEVGFVEVGLSPGQAFFPSAWYFAEEYLGGGGPDGGSHDPPTAVVKQEVPLPTYDSLLPAGSVAVSPPVFLGRFPDGGAFDPPAYRHARRLNLILLNAGERNADFQVLVRPMDDGPPLGTSVVTVAAKGVVFVGNLPFERRWKGSFATFGNAAWIEVTAAEPFLGVVISEIDDAGVGDAKYAAYALRIPPGAVHRPVSGAVFGPPPVARRASSP